MVPRPRTDDAGDMDHEPGWNERERDPGPGLLEIGIIIAAIVVVSALALMLFGGQTSAILSVASGGV